MAVTPSTVQANNKLIQYIKDINFEYVRENAFSPYMGDEITAIIRRKHELKKGGEQMNIPLVTSLQGAGFSSGPLVDAEELIDDYGCRIWIDTARNAVVTNNREMQLDSADVFGHAKPLLSDWGKELQRDEIILALMAVPSESAPVGLGGAAGNRVTGIKWEAATEAQRNTWMTDNADRVMYGNSLTIGATSIASLITVDSTTDIFKASSLSLMKYKAKTANPRIRPYKTGDGREYFVAFCGTLPFRDLKTDLATVNKDARPREERGQNGAPNNPIFQDGDQIYDGVIVREVPEIDSFVQTPWGLHDDGVGATGSPSTGGTRCNPVFLCGQSAVAMAWAQMAHPTERKEDDYGYLKGVGVEMMYGVGKLFKKHPKASAPLKQWGVVTGFFGNTALP
jgi:hypothetical protein